jgi:hypothetical protein
LNRQLTLETNGQRRSVLLAVRIEVDRRRTPAQPAFTDQDSLPLPTILTDKTTSASPRSSPATVRMPTSRIASMRAIQPSARAIARPRAPAMNALQPADRSSSVTPAA